MSEICLPCIVRLGDAPSLDRRRLPHLIEIPVTIHIIDHGPAAPSADHQPIEVDQEGFWSASPTDGIAIGLPAGLGHGPYAPRYWAARNLGGNGSRTGINGGIDRSPASGSPPVQLAQSEGEPPGEERPGSEGEPLTYNEQVRVEQYYSAYRQLQAIDPNNSALGPFLQTPKWIPSDADVANIHASLEAAKLRAATSRNPVPSPDEAITPRDGMIGGLPTGTPADALRGHADNQRGLRRENEAASALAAAGYRVEQNPSWQPGDAFRPLTKPDLRVGNNIFDVYSPTTNNPDTILDTMSKKTRRQADRLVVNLADSSVTPDDLQNILFRKPISGLKEILVIDQQGQIRHLLP